MTKNDLKVEILELKHKLGLVGFEACSAEELAKLESVINDGGSLKKAGLGSVYHRVGVESEEEDVYYKIIEPEASEEELREFMRLRALDDIDRMQKNIQTIKKCAVFFAVLAIIGLVGGFILLMKTFI